jgi:arsenate reductase
MTRKAAHILILCTGNSARSILAEGLINHLGAPDFVAYSAGSQPKGEPHPQALKTLEKHKIDTGFARSKSWDEFAGANAPALDYIITVCDNAAGETCPIWPGKPTTAHWGIPDPADVTAPQATVEAAFDLAYAQLHARISRFLALPFDQLDPTALKQEMMAIGQMEEVA